MISIAIVLCLTTDEPMITTDEVRIRFKKAINQKEEACTLIKELETSNKKQNSLLTGYLGAVYVLYARHVGWPMEKLAYLNKGMKILNNTIQVRFNDPELRLLRFNLENQIPLVLGYSKHLEEDLDFLLNYIYNNPPADKNFLEEIKKSVLDAHYICKEMKEFFLKQLNDLSHVKS